MDQFTSDNPYDLCYSLVWSALEANDGFAALVGSRNRIKFSGTEIDPDKGNLSASDFPVVRIIPVDPDGGLTSTSIAGIERLMIQAATYGKRIDSLNALRWAIDKALYEADQPNGVFTARKWVENVEVTSRTVDEPNPEGPALTKFGWLYRLSLDVRYSIDRNLMKL